MIYHSPTKTVVSICRNENDSSYFARPELILKVGPGERPTVFLAGRHNNANALSTEQLELFNDNALLVALKVGEPRFKTPSQKVAEGGLPCASSPQNDDSAF
ncbi:MAG: hypothetical protein ACFCD0_16315 [Gemmataceae bacterium]